MTFTIRPLVWSDSPTGSGAIEAFPGVGFSYLLMLNPCRLYIVGFSSTTSRTFTHQDEAKEWAEADYVKRITHALEPVEDGELVEVLERLLASAIPHPKDNPSMYAAWDNASKALARHKEKGGGE